MTETASVTACGGPSSGNTTDSSPGTGAMRGKRMQATGHVEDLEFDGEGLTAAFAPAWGSVTTRSSAASARSRASSARVPVVHRPARNLSLE